MRIVQYLASACFILITACSKEESVSESTSLNAIPDWTEETHSNKTTPNYEMVFKQDSIIRIDIKLDQSYWTDMIADLNDLLSKTGPGGGGPGGAEPGGGISIDEDPIWVPCSVFFNNIEWYKVGVRFKGNSSLFSAYQKGINKLSFKLDFDQFEDDFSEIKNQRFYGFKQLNLKNNYDDASCIREKVSGDLFREFGLAASMSSFCEVYVDNGSGPKYFGLYTLVEEPDDTMLDQEFSDGSGNLYKPDGNAASFAAGSYNETEMEKKNNEDEGDFSDVKTLYDVLNGSSRISSHLEWKTQLENIFDIDIFLKWLAANTVMQNWDTYGVMTHNYYLYNNPENNRLQWIPWDGNESMMPGKMTGALSLSMNEVGTNWPLIRYLIDDEQYLVKYKEYVKDFSDNYFETNKMQTLYNKYYLLLKDAVYTEEPGYSFLRSDVDFDNEFAYLKEHVISRKTAVATFLLGK